VEELVQLAPEIRENLWVGTNFYYTVDTPAAKNFVKNYRRNSSCRPAYAPSAAYSMTHMLLAGFDKAKSDDVQAVVKALEGLEMNDIVGPMRWTAPRTRRCAPTSSCACKAKGAMKQSWTSRTSSPPGTRRMPKEYAACKESKLLSLPL